jgi:uncharacterized membrane protein (UPF0127 family)
MSGQALVTIGAKQWLVDIATTYQELTKGLGGLSSLPAGRGMLFDLGSEQIISVTTAPMLFNIDIVFISGNLAVTEVAPGAAPGYLVQLDLPGRFFLEVNAGEAIGLNAGDAVSVLQMATIGQQSIFDEMVPQMANMVVFWAMVYVMVEPLPMFTRWLSGEKEKVKEPAKPPESWTSEIPSKYIYWSKHSQSPAKTEKLVKRIDSYEASTGLKATVDKVIDFAKADGFKITEAEADELLKLRGEL